jgi:endonuclease YncB( thermonuclease family)
MWHVVVILVASAIVWFLDQRQDVPPTERPAASASAATKGGYETFTGCQWVDHRQNDGDSFRVKLPDGRIEQFRLYYVDSPESEFRSYRGGETNRERIHQQAKVFGITDDDAVEIGRRAKKLARELLTRGSFTVQTKWDDPFKDRRYHAFVTPSSGPLLEETLVGEGLARIHTKGAPLPDGTGVKERSKTLRALEEKAKRARRGAWGLATR